MKLNNSIYISIPVFLLEKMASQPPSLNYYEILNCRPNDSIDDIKKSYQALVLKHHPDKRDENGQNSNAKALEEFYRIDEAWKLLREPDKRKQYDAEMRQHKFNDEPIVHAKVYRNDFDFDTDLDIFTYPCRCGGFFALPEDCIEPENCDSSENKTIENVHSINSHSNDDEEIYIECDECSFVVQLLSNNDKSRR